MRDITNEMIHIFRLKKLGCDMMGYTFLNKGELSFHHLVVPHRECKALGLGEGYLFWNGAILNQKTAHPYLHLIEAKDRDMFVDITNVLIKENDALAVEIEYLKRIREILLAFEREHDHDRNKHGGLILRREYVEKRVPVLEEEKRLIR